MHSILKFTKKCKKSVKSIKIFYKKVVSRIYLLYFSNFITKIKNSWNHISNEFRVLWQYSASKSCQVIEWCLWQVDNSRPSQHFSEGGAGMVGILGYVMGGVYVTNVNNQNRWGCPYLSKNASCTLDEKNYKISMTWKITFGQQQSESRRFISFPDTPSIYSASPSIILVTL